MAVRLKVEITSEKATAEAVAIANSGYEAENPEIVVPLSYAKRVLKVTSRGKREKFFTAGKREIEFRVVGDVSVRVVARDRPSPTVRATLIVADRENEVILNDALAEALGVQLVHLKRGTWRFLDDPGNMERPSEVRHLY